MGSIFAFHGFLSIVFLLIIAVIGTALIRDWLRDNRSRTVAYRWPLDGTKDRNHSKERS